MKVLPIIQSRPQQNFKANTYSAKEICADLCKGACCDHGTVMNANLKRITDKLCASYQSISDGLKSLILIKAPIIKWRKR